MWGNITSGITFPIVLLQSQLYKGSHRSVPSSNARPRPIGWGYNCWVFTNGESRLRAAPFQPIVNRGRVPKTQQQSSLLGICTEVSVVSFRFSAVLYKVVGVVSSGLRDVAFL